MDIKDKTKKSIVFLAIAGVISVLLLIIVTINIILAVQLHTNPEKLPSIFGTSPVIIGNDLLKPDMGKNDLAFMNTGEASIAKAKPGDFAAFRFDGVLLVEPIIDKTTSDSGVTLYNLKDDTELEKESFTINQNDILGIYSWKIPKIGAVFVFSQTPFGIVLFLLIPALLYFVYFFIIKDMAIRKGRFKFNQLSNNGEN